MDNQQASWSSTISSLNDCNANKHIQGDLALGSQVQEWFNYYSNAQWFDLSYYTFNINDIPQALYIQQILGHGTRPTLVKISNLSGIILVISLINGYFRTGKKD